MSDLSEFIKGGILGMLIGFATGWLVVDSFIRAYRAVRTALKAGVGK